MDTSSSPPWRGNRVNAWSFALMPLALMAALVAGVVFAKPLARVARAVLPAGMTAGDHAHASAEKYTCGMHPWVILPEPGDCPICHMKLVPLVQQAVSDALTIDPAITQRIGVRTTQARLSDTAAAAIDAPATLTWDDRKLQEITVKYTGWVDELFVRTQGQHVRQGQLLARIDSPEVFVAQEEYLSAWRRHAQASHNNTSPSAAATSLLAAATRRLAYLGLTAGQIDALAKRGSSSRTVELYSPAAGFIVGDPVRQGAAIAPGSVLFRIADLSTIWAMAAVHQRDLPHLQPGQRATVTLPAQAVTAIQGQVDFIYPQLDPVTRQAQVRIILPNPDLALRPGMLASVKLHVAIPQSQLLIPRDAVLTQGDRSIVMLAMGQGKFQPQAVSLAGRVGRDMVIVTDGLTPDQRIVAQGQFLLDSEANMRIALGQMTTPGRHADHDAKDDDAPRTLTPEAADAINQLIDRYLVISDALAQNKADLHPQAMALAEAAKAAALPHAASSHAASLAREARKLAGSQGRPLPLKEAREVFLKLSHELVALLERTGVPSNRPTPVHPIECSMYKHGSSLPAGGQWVTPQDVVRNPYFGPMMLGCYTDQSTFPVAQVAQASPSSATQPSEAEDATHNHSHGVHE